MVEFVLQLHSWVRWVIVGVALGSVVVFGLIWAGRLRPDKRMWALMAAFAGLIDLQMTLGIIYLLWNGLAADVGFPMYRIEHAVTMLVAVVVAHMNARWRTAGDTVRARNNVLIILAVLILIYLGVARLPQGWMG
jgi:hypothetical protein